MSESNGGFCLSVCPLGCPECGCLCNLHPSTDPKRAQLVPVLALFFFLGNKKLFSTHPGSQSARWRIFSLAAATPPLGPPLAEGRGSPPQETLPPSLPSKHHHRYTSSSQWTGGGAIRQFIFIPPHTTTLPPTQRAAI